MYREYVNADGLKIILPDTVYENIKEVIKKYYPNECGGIFAGKIQGKTAEIDEMAMPKKFKNSPVFFLRVAASINKWLKQKFNKSKGGTFYLGEWHSHPNLAPYPSHTDYNSMKKIAMNPDVRIETPILLIVSYKDNTFEERFYIYHNQKLVSYELQ